MEIDLDKRKYRMIPNLARETTRRATKTNRSGYNPIQRQMWGEAQPNGPDWMLIFQVSFRNQRSDVTVARGSPLGN